MNRTAISVVGGLIGLTTGMLCVRPVAAYFGATSITWNAQNCPAGIYTIAALAHTQSTAQTYSATMREVSLPAASVVQQFDLPVGTYQVSATAIGNNGLTFQSETQTVNGLGGTGGGSTGQGPVLGRTGGSTRVAAGTARPRSVLDPTPPRPPSDSRLSPPGDATRTATAASRRPAHDAFDRLALDPLLQKLLMRLEMAEPDASDPAWRRLAAVDIDGDGVLDIVTMELVTGETWVIQIVR